MPTIYLATGDGPVVLRHRAGRWQAERPLDVRSAVAMAADLRHPERVFCATKREGVWRSDDAGAGWQPVFEGIPHDSVTALAVSDAERVDGRAVVFVGTEPSAIYRSDDDGNSWRACEGLADLPSSDEWSFPPRPETHHVRWIEPDPHERGRIYVAIEAGALVQSPDGGATWIDRVPSGPYDTHQLVTHTHAPARLWSAAGDGFYESRDGGSSWQKPELGLRHRYCWSLAINSTDPGVLVLSAAAGPTQAHAASRAEAHLYRRSADGEPWREVREGLPNPAGVLAYALAADPVEPSTFYAGSAGELFRSTDAGETWHPLDVGWPDGYDGSRIHAVYAALR